MNIQKMLTHIDRRRPQVIDWLKELVGIPTVNPPGTNYSEIVGVLEERCRAMGMTTRIVSVPTAAATPIVPYAGKYPRLNLISRWEVNAPKTLHFNAHFDVVPVSDGWRVDPFKPTVAGDWLTGRGADDMKDSIAAMLFAISALRESGLQPSFNIECSFTCDEEIGGELGTGYLVDRGLIHADYVVNGEGGSGLDIGLGHNGVLWLEVDVRGKSAHGARPNEGINAFEESAALVMHLGRLKRALSTKQRRYTTFSGEDRYPTVNIGGIFRGTAGDKVNTVPARASFTIDRRVLPNEELDEAESELRAAIAGYRKSDPGVTIGVGRLLGIGSSVSEPDLPFSIAFKNAVQRVRKRSPSFQTAKGFTDLHYFLEAGFPGVGYGPQGEKTHGMNERVRISDVVKTAKIYAILMARGHEAQGT